MGFIMDRAPSLPEGPDPAQKPVCPGRFHLTDDWVDNNHMPCQDCGVAYGDHPEVPDPEKGEFAATLTGLTTLGSDPQPPEKGVDLDPLPAVADAARHGDPRLQAFQIAFADYSAGHLTFESLMTHANAASWEHPAYVGSLMEKFKMSKSTPEAKPARSAEPSPSSVAPGEAMKKALADLLDEHIAWVNASSQNRVNPEESVAVITARAALADASREGV